jgi:hypothetical protein
VKGKVDDPRISNRVLHDALLGRYLGEKGAFPPLHRGGRRENFADSAVDATFVPLIGAL